MYKIQGKNEYQKDLVLQYLDLKFEHCSSNFEKDIYQIALEMYNDAYDCVVEKNKIKYFSMCIAPAFFAFSSLLLYVESTLSYYLTSIITYSGTILTGTRLKAIYDNYDILFNKFQETYPNTSLLLFEPLNQLKKDMKKIESQLINKKLDIMSIDDDIRINEMRQISCQDTPIDQFTKIEEIKYYIYNSDGMLLSIEKLNEYRNIILNYNNSGLSYNLNNTLSQVKIKRLDNIKKYIS